MTQQTTLPLYDLICAWCDLADDQVADTDGNSHGICPICYEKQLRELEHATTWIILSDGSRVAVPEGADPEAYRKFREAQLHPRERTTPRRNSSHSAKASRKWTAGSMLGQANSQALALAELTERVNQKETR